MVREVKGYSRQKGYLDRYVGSEYSMAFLPKVGISVAVADAEAEEVAARVVRAARTGRIGDGKVFVVPMAWPEPQKEVIETARRGYYLPLMVRRCIGPRHTRLRIPKP